MSKRSKRGREPETARPGSGAAKRKAAPQAEAGAAGGRAGAARSGWGLGVQLAFVVGVFAIVVLVAELAGAANLGVALGIGQIAFAIAVLYVLVWR